MVSRTGFSGLRVRSEPFSWAVTDAEGVLVPEEAVLEAV